MEKTQELNGSKEKIKNGKNHNNLEVKKEMAYYCKLCQCWHYFGSAIFEAHKRYASQRVRPKKIVPRKKKKSFWDNW
jgi:hypothetical protein